MARNRVIYQSEALYVSTDVTGIATGNHKQLERVQSANYNFSIARQDINQFGQLSRIDTMVLEAPTVNMDISYYLTDGFNEKALGFNTAGSSAASFVSGQMLSSSGQNLYIVTSKEGFDANGAIANNDAFPSISIGNAYVSNYSVEMAVGAIPTVSVSFEAANICSSSISAANGTTSITGITHPAIVPANGAVYTGVSVALAAPITGLAASPTALRPGDITVTFGSFADAGTTGTASSIVNLGLTDGIHLQSASLSIPLSRSPIQRLGSKFPYARPIDFPIKATLSVQAVVNEVVARNLAGMLTDNIEKDITLTLNNELGAAKSTFYLKSCTLDSESFSSSIGANKTVDLTFSTQIGAINDTTKGVFYLGTTA